MIKFENLLPIGKENAVPTKELMRLYNLTERELRGYIQLERNNGACICSCMNGYYIPASDEDIIEQVKRMRSKAFSMIKTSNKMEQKAKEDKDQLKLF